VHADDRERTAHAWDQAAETGSVFEAESRLRRASDGACLWYLMRAIPLPDAGGETITWFGTCTEIEQQKRMEKQEKLESLGRLAGGLAHDLNNLLVVILGGASYALEKLAPSHPAREELQDVAQAGEQAAELVRRMLAYAGKANLSVGRAQVDPLVRDAVARAGVPEKIHLEILCGPGIPLVRTDSELLRQAVADLLRNAVEAIGPQASGFISVRTEVIEIDGDAPAGIAPGKYVAVEVRDTGCGMDAETQKYIFDPFFSTKFLGRGLGLAAVQGFARSNGGVVEVDSSPGKGSVFRLLLPEALDQSTGASL